MRERVWRWRRELLLLAILVVVLLVILFLIYNTIHIVRQYERLVVFTFGRVTNGSAGPGIVLLVPIVQIPVKVDPNDHSQLMIGLAG